MTGVRTPLRRQWKERTELSLPFSLNAKRKSAACDHNYSSSNANNRVRIASARSSGLTKWCTGSSSWLQALLPRESSRSTVRARRCIRMRCVLSLTAGLPPIRRLQRRRTRGTIYQLAASAHQGIGLDNIIAGAPRHGAEGLLDDLVVDVVLAQAAEGRAGGLAAHLDLYGATVE